MIGKLFDPSRCFQVHRFRGKVSIGKPSNISTWSYRFLKEKEKTRGTQRRMGRLQIVILSLEISSVQVSSTTVHRRVGVRLMRPYHCLLPSFACSVGSKVSFSGRPIFGNKAHRVKCQNQQGVSRGRDSFSVMKTVRLLIRNSA